MQPHRVDTGTAGPPREHGPQSTEPLREQLAEAEDRAWEMERKLLETLSSTSNRLGQALVFAARRPKALLRLPAGLWRLYRGRGERQDVSAAMTFRPERLLSDYRSLTREHDGPLIVVVASRRVARSLGAEFDVVPLWPNDARQLGKAISPDVVIVESGAAMPGEAWSALGTAIEAGREALLLDVIGDFQRRSVPVVFWWTTPLGVTSNLEPIARRCDLMASDNSILGMPDGTPLSLGVDLGQVDPTNPSERGDAGKPLLHLGAYEPDPRAAPANRLVEVAVSAGAEILYDPSHLHTREQTLRPCDARHRYRSATWTTPTASGLSDRCIAMLASGVPVLMTKAPDDFRNVVTEVASEADVLGVAESARRRTADPAVMRDILRTVHGCGTTRHRFSGLLGSLGIEIDASAEDEVGVSVEACSSVDAVVAAINEQSIRPTEVLVDDAETRRQLITGLDPIGIPVRSPEHAKASRHVPCTDRARPKTYLHDLVVASRVAGTDRFSDDYGIVMTGSSGVEMPLPWWMAGAHVG